MPFTSLPPETLLQIALLIPPSSLPSFSHLTSLTYRTTHHLLLPILTRQHRNSKMLHRFGSPTRRLGLCIIDPVEYISSTPQLAEKFTEPEEGKLADLEYLRLNGDLHWLLPLDGKTVEGNMWRQGDAVDVEELDHLTAQAESVGVELPPGFLKFMGSEELIDRIYLGGDFFALNSEGLVKCKPQDDKDSGGYMVRFMSDQQACCYWSLYLAPGGYSCVMDCPTDVDCWEGRDEAEREDHPEPEAYKNVPVAFEGMGWTLAHPSFEEWLCMRYFDGWNSACLGKRSELEGRQMEYLESFWGKKEGGRV